MGARSFPVSWKLGRAEPRVPSRCLGAVFPCVGLASFHTPRWDLQAIVSVCIADCWVYGKLRIRTQMARIGAMLGASPRPLTVGVTAIPSEASAGGQRKNQQHHPRQHPRCARSTNSWTRHPKNNVDDDMSRDSHVNQSVRADRTIELPLGKKNRRHKIRAPLRYDSRDAVKREGKSWLV
jgi:hypothetical protein